MTYRNSIGAMALAAALVMTIDAAPAFDGSKYPNLKGQWIRERAPAGVIGQGDDAVGHTVHSGLIGGDPPQRRQRPEQPGPQAWRQHDVGSRAQW